MVRQNRSDRSEFSAGQSGDVGSEFNQQRGRRMRGYLREKTSGVSEHVHESAANAKDWFSNAMDEYPLAMGGAFMILGLAAGFAIPTTQPERKMIGRTGKRLMQRAQEMGGRLVDQGEQAAEHAIDAARESIKGRSRSPGSSETS